VRRILACALVLLFLPLPVGEAQTLELGKPVVMRAAAVSQAPDGSFVGSTATITISAAANGSGHVFLDTFPLTAVDMQGSARLAARVASQISGKPLASYDFFFVIRSGSEQIGGPSAGADMTVGAIAALNGWTVRPDVLMTGTIEPDGSVGPVGGIPEKAAAAAQVGVTEFLFPQGEEISKLSRTGQAVNLTQYCASQLQITCTPVADVVEAVNVMTDHRIEQPPVTGEVTGADYLARLAPLSSDLVNASLARAAEARAAVAALPAGASRSALETRLTDVGAQVAQAQGAARNGTYYAAASLSFQASIDAHAVREMASLVNASDARQAAADRIAEDAGAVDVARSEVDAFPVDHVGLFEPGGAAQVRLLEAETRLEVARATLRNATTNAALQDALFESSYAAERAETARWWLQLGRGFSPGAPIDPKGLEELARDEITAGTEEVAYVEAVFGQANVGTTLTEARGKLDEAQTALARGYQAAAMLDGLEASVIASTALEAAGFAGQIPPAKVESSRLAAARAIATARARGVEPFLAESEYEFGVSQTDTTTQLRFFGMARVSANLAGLPGAFGSAPQQAATRFQGLPEVYAPPSWIVAAFAVGLALGAGLGLFALLPKDEEPQPSPPAVGWEPAPAPVAAAPVEPALPPIESETTQPAGLAPEESENDGRIAHPETGRERPDSAESGRRPPEQP